MNFLKFTFIINYLLLISATAGLTQHYHTKYCGVDDSPDRKIYILNKIGDNYLLVSPFHNIPLYQDSKNNIVNMVVEIPKGTQEKIEINKAHDFNPLMYDIKDNKIRKITYKAKHTNISGYPFHYGALPQTWEHSGQVDIHTKFYGDNDPVDAFDISSINTTSGDIIQVKVLGALAMIDNDETDWKIIVINIKDPMAKQYHSYLDVPWGKIDSIYDFLLNYKTAEGKAQNKFYEKIFWDQKEAIEIINELHNNWENLCTNREATAAIVKANKPKKLIELPVCQHLKHIGKKPYSCP
jgi:inorganic pyrophosphatase